MTCSAAAFVPVLPSSLSVCSNGAAQGATAALSSSISIVRAFSAAPLEASLSSSYSFAIATTAELSSSSSAASFEPVLPSTVTLIGMGSVLVLCVIAAVVWSEQVVPISRTKLALSKRNGQVKDYLDELAEESDEKRPLETWLFTDWLQARNSTSVKKEPALPILKSAKWNSGDNPVLVTSAMLMVGILVAAITERV